MNKKLLGLFVCMLMVTSILPIAGIAEYEVNLFEIQNGVISVSITIGDFEIKNTENGDEITVEDYGHRIIPGKPDLPSRIYSIAIPPGARLVDVDYDISESIVLSGCYNVQPVETPSPLCEEEDFEVSQLELKKYDENYDEVYGGGNPYPALPVEFVRTSGFRKYNLVDVRVMPFKYYSQTGQLVYYPEINIDVSYSFPEGFDYDQIMVDDVSGAEQFAEEFIFNYDQAKVWYPAGSGSRQSYDYVIITISSLESYVQGLVEWEEKKGRTVYVANTSWIGSNYDGYDLQEKMRNFLRDKYPSEEWGIMDVCLIGHYDDVPMRRVAQNTGYGQPETDFYYAELSEPDSSSWDSDGDHLYGEDSDTVDMYSEINVGRIPWSDSSIVEHICNKSIAYEQNNNESFKKNILLIGAFFWPDTDNAVLMELKTDSEENPWMEDWNRTRMYEEAQSEYECDYDISYDNVKNVWSSGTYGFVNWAGHGSPTGCYEYYPSQAFVNTGTCSYLDDDYPAIIFACACSNSDTDYTNIGQKMMEQGAVGFLGATKVSYGYHGWSDPYSYGCSASFDYFFSTKTTSGNYTQGGAHQWSLAEMYTHDLWYYTKYEAFEWGSLWGNPDLTMGDVNQVPDEPTDPSPSSGTVDVLIDTLISWSCSDPNGDDLVYDVYFEAGDPNPDVLVSDDQDSTTYDPGLLEYETTYYWKIIAKDTYNLTTSGMIWNFTTEENAPPIIPSNPIPGDGENGVDIDHLLYWNGGDPNPYDTVTFDVYFGTTSPPPLVAEDLTQSAFDPGTMELETTYYWQIKAKDNHGLSTIGPIWHFTTELAPNDPPGAPTIDGPIDGDPGTEYDYVFNSVDPDGDDVKYHIDWGDTTSDTTGLNPSGADVTVSHIWAGSGKYTITAFAEDSKGSTGPTSTFQVTMPRNKSIMNLFLRFLQSHQNLLLLFQTLLQRLGLL
jgi:hypothetical protein